jgi:tetratricopeptide (TPR) repeat protein
MEEIAEAGSTYVSKETFRLTEGLFQFETLGKKAVKGKKKAIPVYKVLSRKERVYRPRLGSERVIFSEMVGRNRELDKLELQVMKAINGEGSVVNIIGEAGIGKSRLVAELKKREVVKKVALFEGRAISIGRKLSFHPIIDLLKQWARMREDDGEAAALGKLETAVRNICPEEFYEILPFVATLMGMKLSGRYAERVEGIEGEALEKLILKSVRELLIEATELTPLVIVAEDLHWADTSSIELIESLFRLAETQRILFINVFRPGHKETGERIVETIKEKLPVYYVEIALKPLEEKISEALITNVLNIRELHQTVVGQIIERAGGNPFFIEEVLRSFIDDGALVPKEGTYEVTEKIAKMAVPSSINDVLMARIDRLDEKTRDLVKVASVIGRSFFHRVLVEVVSTVDDIDSRLFHLKQIQLLRERKRLGEVEYLFNHALAQEAAYDSILPLKRKKLHLKVARAIEKVFGERIHEFYGMLAYHYSKAESLEETEEYLIKAGEEALKSSASNEALHYYQEALSIYLIKYGDDAEPEKVAMFDKSIALALYNRGRYDEAVEFFDKALKYLWGNLPKNPISTGFKFFSGFLHLLISLYLPSLKFKKIPTQRDKEILYLFYKKLEALAIINPRRFFIESFHYYKRVTSFDLTKIELGFSLFVGASALFSFTGISFRLSRKILNLVKDRVDKQNVKPFIIYEFLETLHNYFEGNWKAIKEYDDDLVNKNLSIGEVYFASQHFYWHGCPKIYQGHLDIPKLLVNKLFEIGELYENDLSILLKCFLNTNLLMESRKLHDALIEVEEGIDFAQKKNLDISLIDMFSCKAWIHILMREIAEAEKSLEQANKIRSEVDAVPTMLSNFYRSQFEYFIDQIKESLRTGNKSGLSNYRKTALKYGRLLVKISRKAALHRTESYKLMGVYFWLIKKQKRALKWWNKATNEGERLEAHLELSRVYFEIGKRLLEDKSNYKKLNGIKAERYLEKAKVLFDEMDLQWDLDELRRIGKA